MTNYYLSDPDWASYVKDKGIDIATRHEGDPTPLDIDAGRIRQTIEETKWANEHPLELVGYQSKIQHIKVRDEHPVEIKVSWPQRSETKSENSNLPLIFVCHGGGWIQGTHTTEEAWLLWPLMKHLKFVTVSVAYRLAPEHLYPTYINDCWDVLQAVASKESSSSFALDVPFDHERIILGGSSAGALIAATLAQKVLKSKTTISILGVLLNVPITCDYRFWPADTVNQSYQECESALLNSSVMRQVWDIAVPAGVGRDPQASPLLGITPGLPPHLIYVAGQDPLRDEGIEYARLLMAHNNSIKLRIYPGVPHTFAEIWELKATRSFWTDVVDDVKAMLQISPDRKS